VPALPGALSAVGILLADTVREYSRTVMKGVDTELEDVFAELEAQGRAEFATDGLEGVAMRSVDLRYAGQGYELNVAYGDGMVKAFHALHKRRYGFAKEDGRLEIVNVRVRFVAAAEPFVAAKMELVDGDGSAALMGERPVYFDGVVHATRLYERDGLRAGDVLAGPAIVSEYSSATIVPPGDVLRVDAWGNLVICISEGRVGA
jgi:N-methylhydantoinase A